MSNSLAIAAVTITLRKLLDHAVSDEISGATVTMQAPDVFATPSATSHVNLFLYHTSIDAAFRNSDMPHQVRPGETGQPPLALNLYYLLTAYGAGDDATEPLSHRLLGRVMSIFHDHPVLSAADIKAAIPTTGTPPPYDLFDQIERVRIIPQPLTGDDMSKLWTMLQAKYRPSVAYQAAVVLIESTRPARTPLPVLRRGKDDRGVDAQSNLTVPYPTLTALMFPAEQQPSAQLGDVITLHGHHLDGDAAMIARFRHPRLALPIDIPLPAVATSGETDVAVTLPNDAAAQSAWAAGSVTVSLVVSRSTDPLNPTRITNELSFALAPRIVTRTPATASSAAAFTETVTCSPEVRPEQRVSLLFGGSEIAANEHAAQTNTLDFNIVPTAALKGDQFLRLRVDGVDSLLVDYQHTPLEFDPNQKVTVT
jgi:hypothetical protein